MNCTSRNGFVHSVKVPRIYKTASAIVKKVVEEGGSLKDLVYNSGHKNIKGVFALVVKTIQHNQELDNLLAKSKLLKNETRLQPWLAKILITELFYGKKELKGDSKPVQTVLAYKKQFDKLIKNKLPLEPVRNPVVKKPRYVRVNTLHQTPDEIIKLFRGEGWNFVPTSESYVKFLELISALPEDSFTRDFHIKELLVFPGCTQFYENELYQNGTILLQDKASCLPAFLLRPPSNSVALDMCAAPGMKTTHLSAIMRNKGRIYATELSTNRYQVLCDVVEKAGCVNVTPINVDALKLTSEGSDDPNLDASWCRDVEYILVDPSCSGSGIVERVQVFDDVKQDAKRLKRLYGFQVKLLLHALTNFPNVKRVVYSTCSVHAEENEKVVEDVIRKLEDLRSADETVSKDRYPRLRLTTPLKDTWPRRGSSEYEVGDRCIYANPKGDHTNGFFIAVFERDENQDEDQEVTGNEGDVETKKMSKRKKKS